MRTEHDSQHQRHEKHVTWILIETAHRLVRSSPRFRRFYAAVAKRKGGKIAITATAHKLLHIIYYMLRNGVDYKEGARG